MDEIDWQHISRLMKYVTAYINFIFLVIQSKGSLARVAGTTAEMAVNFTNSTLSNLTNLIEQRSSGKAADQPAWYWITKGLISIVTVSGNGVVVFLIITRRNLHITCNWFVLSLSIVDFFVGLLLPWLSFICRQEGISCDYAVFFSAFNTVLAISVANTCMMTFDRYIGLVYALQYRMFMTPKRIIFLTASTWVFPAILAFLPFLWHGHVSIEIQNQAKKIYTAAMLIIFEFLPPVILLFMYMQILHTARRLRRQTAVQLAQLSFNQASESNIIPNSRQRLQERSVRVIGAVVILFVLCWTFDIYKSLCRHYFKCSVDKTVLDQVSLLFIYTNSALNPVVYALLKRDIRTELRNLFRCS